MPIVSIHTNLARSQITGNFLSDVTKGAAAILSTDQKGVQVVVNTDCLMAFGGTTEPNATISVFAAGQIVPDKNEVMAAEFTALFVSKLGVPKERMLLLLRPIPQSEACYMGKTVEALIKSNKK